MLKKAALTLWSLLLLVGGILNFPAIEHRIKWTLPVVFIVAGLIVMAIWVFLEVKTSNSDFTGKQVVLDMPENATASDASMIREYNLRWARGKCVSDAKTYLRVRFSNITLDLARNLFSLAK